MRSEPFLWIHLSGLAVVPLTLTIVWLGLAIGTPLPLSWLELILVAVIGIVPILWMQWYYPFDIFSILLLAIKADALSLEQRRILSLFKTGKQRFLSAIAALVMLLLLWQLYQLAPLAIVAASIFPQWRIAGLGIAAVAFLISNLFVQVPVSVLGVLLTSESQFQETEPYPVEEIPQKFTIPGFRVEKIFP